MKQKTENTLLWISGRIVLPDRICENGSVLIENERITAVNEACPDGAEIREVADGYILPGFVDIHVHGGNGFSTCFDPKQAYFTKIEDREMPITPMTIIIMGCLSIYFIAFCLFYT